MKSIFFSLTILSLLLIACDIKEQGISDAQILEVHSLYGSQLITHFKVPFKAQNAAGVDLTSHAIFYIDGQAQSSNILEFNQTGSYNVTASITLDGQTITSQAMQVQVIVPQSTTKILVEDYTGTWCTNCPRVTYKLDQAVSQNDHIIPVAIHYSRWQGDDPLGFNEITTLTRDFNISGLPSPIVNRRLGHIWDEQYTSLQALLDQPQPLGLSVASQISSNQLDLTVSVRFDMDFSKKNVNLVIYLTENDLHADQANATNYYGGQDPIPNFEQNHTLRVALNGVYGLPIPSSQMQANHIHTYHFSGAVPSEITQIDHCDIEAFVIDGDDQNAPLINIQKAAIGTTQDFD